MAKDITIKNPAGSVTYYPKTVSQLVYDNESGRTVKQDIDDIKLNISSKTTLQPKSITEGAYINNSGGISTGGSTIFKVAFYDIEPNTTYNIYNKYHNSTSARNFAVYSSTETTSANCIHKGETTNVSSDNTLYANGSDGVILAVQTNGAYEYAFQEAEYIDVEEISNSIAEINSSIDDIIDVTTIETTRTDYVRIPNTYISDNNGNTSSSNSYNLDYFEVSTGEKYTIHFEGNTASPAARSYAMYSALPFDSSTKIGTVGQMIGSNPSLTLDVTIEEGANYLACAEMSETAYPTFVRTVTEKLPVDYMIGILEEDIDDVSKRVRLVGIDNLDSLNTVDSLGKYIVYYTNERMKIGSLEVYAEATASFIVQVLNSNVHKFLDGSYEFDTTNKKNHQLTRYYSLSTLTWSEWEEDDISEMKEDFDTLYTDAEVTEWQEDVGQYITNDAGNIGSFNAYNLDYFVVQPGEVYDIDISVTGANAAARAYAMYSDYPFSTSNKVGTVGPKVSAGWSGTVTIAEGASYLALCGFKIASYPQYTRTIIKRKAHFITDTIDDMQTEIDEIQESIHNNDATGSICVEFDSDGESVYAAYLENPTTEITYWFKKCMANELYTFYRVGYRTVSRSYPDTEGIKNETGITLINRTASDNIGPIFLTNPTSTDTAGHWTGGNHRYPNETAEVTYKTASNYSYAPYADNEALVAGDKKYCEVVTINVVNHLFDPYYPPNEGDTILSTLFSTETVLYKIKKNSIEVSLRQQIVPNNTNRINMYLGMQSMFFSENKVMTPNGEWNTWHTVASGDADFEFTKGNYPNFNRYIESNSVNATYQSAYLLPNKMGTHNIIDDSDYIFRRHSGKCYHHLIDMLSNVGGKSLVWSGVYTFFHTPILNDSNVFVYSGIINGKDAIYINTLQACDIDIDLPNEYLMRKMNVLEISNDISTENTFTDVVGIHITASGTGSLIFTLD